MARENQVYVGWRTAATKVGQSAAAAAVAYTTYNRRRGFNNRHNEKTSALVIIVITVVIVAFLSVSFPIERRPTYLFTPRS